MLRIANGNQNGGHDPILRSFGTCAVALLDYSFNLLIHLPYSFKISQCSNVYLYCNIV